MAYDWPTPSPGVLARHADDCPARDGGVCMCGPIGFRAEEDGRPIGPLLETEVQARAWRREQRSSLDTAEHEDIVAEAVDGFLDAARSGAVRRPDGRRYSRAELRDLTSALDDRVASDRAEPVEWTPAARSSESAAMIPDQALWLSLKVAVLVFVLVAMVLVAESV